MASLAAPAGNFSNKARHKMLKAHNHALTQLSQKRRKQLKQRALPDLKPLAEAQEPFVGKHTTIAVEKVQWQP